MAKYWKHLEKHPDAVEKHKITDEEIAFLKNLQKEMNTQDTVGQADPRYWVIRDYEKICGSELNNADGIVIYDIHRGETILEMDYSYANIEETAEKILEVLHDDGYELDEDTIASIRTAYDVSSLVERINEIEECDFQISEYQEIPVDKGMFLTHEAAIQHLKNNDYHYSENAHTFGMTAWRSSEERLWKILQTVDFDQLI